MRFQALALVRDAVAAGQGSEAPVWASEAEAATRVHRR
jgi:hypothetical protein